MSDKQKNVLYWVLGIVICGLGLSLSTKSGLGLSMIGAMPYILHVWLRDSLPWFTQGVAEYVLQALLLILLCLIVRRFRASYLLSFGTAVLAGLVIDGWLLLLGGNGVYASMLVRVIAFIAGMLLTSLAIACYFRTSLPMQVYELCVSELADTFHWPKTRVKWGFDITMLALDVVLGLVLMGKLVGVGLGTVLITCVNAPLIGMFGKLLDRLEGKK